MPEKNTKFKKKFITIYSSLSFIRIIYLGSVYYVFNFKYVLIIYLAAFLFTVYVTYLGLYSKIKYSIKQIIDLFIKPYILLYFLINIFFWKHLPIFSLWGIFFPFATLYDENKKKTLTSGLYILLIVILTPIISLLINVDSYADVLFEKLSDTQIFFLNISLVVLIFITFVANITLYLEYEKNEENEIKELHAIPLTKEKKTDIKNAVYEIKFDKLYDKVTEYIEKERCYTNSNIKIADIARGVGTNKTYVSIALNKKGKKFNELINYYRIEQAKKDLLENKKSMREIYIEAGFKYSATFNNVFEEVEGVKPVQYRYLKEIKQDS